MPNWKRLVRRVTEVWPEHARYIAKSEATLIGAERDAVDGLAELILKAFSDDLDLLVQGYRWTCEQLLAEELNFRRSGRYSRSTFAETKAAVYDNAAFMVPYIHGLLLSQVLWSNHAKVFALYRSAFLAGNRDGYRHLEVGPGHGFWLYYAAIDPRSGALSAWDASRESLNATRQTLRVLGADAPVALEQIDVLAATLARGPYDSVVISEVLEHLEDPQRALRILHACTAEYGRIFVNMPINSPAPDHIYMVTEPEQVGRLVKESGFRIVEQRNFPITGYSEARARQIQATVSCVVIAEKRGQS